MSKRNHSPNFKACMCSVCGAEAVSSPGKRHRRCTGQKPSGETEGPVAIRPKHQAIPSANKGVWQ